MNTEPEKNRSPIHITPKVRNNEKTTNRETAEKGSMGKFTQTRNIKT